MLSNTTRLAKIPSKSQYVSIIENDNVSPLRKEPALCLRQIKKGKKVAFTSEGEIGKGRCGFELSVTALTKPFDVVQEIAV